MLKFKRGTVDPVTTIYLSEIPNGTVFEGRVLRSNRDWTPLGVFLKVRQKNACGPNTPMAVALTNINRYPSICSVPYWDKDQPVRHYRVLRNPTIIEEV